MYPLENDGPKSILTHIAHIIVKVLSSNIHFGIGIALKVQEFSDPWSQRSDENRRISPFKFPPKCVRSFLFFVITDLKIPVVFG